MLSTEIHEAAVDFGRALNQAPAVTAYRAAADAFASDPVAQSLMADLREQQSIVARAQRTGLAPSREQIDRMRLCQTAVRANEVIMGHLRATNEVKAFLPAVAGEVSRALGTDFGSLIAQASC